MKEKVLILASVASMIDQFNIPNINLLQSLDYDVHVACNFEKGSTCSLDKIMELKKKLDLMNVKIYQIDFTRSVFDIKQDIIAYRQVKKIMVDNKYKFIHCHSPIGGVVGRLACKFTKTKCIYTAHGFHFYKGAPFKNWMIFYPIEKWLSRYTNVLITINQEDFERAKKKLKVKHIVYVPGIGINLKKFQFENLNQNTFRKEFGLMDDDIMLISVGELNVNKNHQIVIKALGEIKNPRIHYIVAGQGNRKQDLLNLAKEYKMEDRLHLLGFRNDIAKLYKESDIFIHPSFREGLSVAVMEAMACGLPCIVSNIRGNKDLIDKEGGFLFELTKLSTLRHAIEELVKNKNLREKYGNYNEIKINSFSIDKIQKMMKDIYEMLGKELL